MKKNTIIFALLLLTACSNVSTEEPLITEKQEEISKPPRTTPNPKKLWQDSCLCISKTIKHALLVNNSEEWSRTIILPLTGKFTEESHYVTSFDQFSDGRLFPNSSEENIQKHLNISLQIYKEYDPTITEELLYGKYWQREWTPAEGGEIGQGSVGDIQLQRLSPGMELWMMNMMWASGERPEVGTKFLLQANGKSVVVIAGFETGPAAEHFLGGVTPEVHHWLGTSPDFEIKISLLENQNLPHGPIDCVDLLMN